jgi:ADP-ribosylation factor-like protein 4
MGGGLAKLDHPVHVVMLGLDSAGKSTVLYRLKFDQYVNTVPTVGFNCEKVKGTIGKAKGVSFMIWDVGGQDKVRPLWRSYTRNTDGIVFVVDSSDSERMEEARTELIRTARQQENCGVPVLVVANKQDLPGSLDSAEIEKMLALHELSQQHLWQIQPACAITGEGLDEGLDSLYEMIIKRRKTQKGKKKR